MPSGVEILRSASEMDRIQPLWERCYEADTYASIFQSFAWNRALAERLADREQPNVIVAQDSENQLTIIPAARIDKTATLLGENLADYRSCLTTDSGSSSFLAAWSEMAKFQQRLQFTALRPEHHA